MIDENLNKYLNMTHVFVKYLAGLASDSWINTCDVCPWFLQILSPRHGDQYSSM